MQFVLCVQGFGEEPGMVVVVVAPGSVVVVVFGVVSARTVPAIVVVPQLWKRLKPLQPVDEIMLPESTSRLWDATRFTRPPSAPCACVPGSSVSSRAGAATTICGASIWISPTPPVASTGLLAIVNVPRAVPSNAPPLPWSGGPLTSIVPVTLTLAPPSMQTMPPNPTPPWLSAEPLAWIGPCAASAPVVVLKSTQPPLPPGPPWAWIDAPLLTVSAPLGATHTSPPSPAKPAGPAPCTLIFPCSVTSPSA